MVLTMVIQVTGQGRNDCIWGAHAKVGGTWDPKGVNPHRRVLRLPSAAFL